MELHALIKIIICITIVIGISLAFFILKKKRKEILLTLFTLFFTACIIEIFFRMFYPQIMEHDKMFEYDSRLGWKFIPNKKGAIVYSANNEVNNYIKTNSYGFRDNTFVADKKNRKKILVVGDSFVSNISVKLNEVFTEILQSELNNTEVINFGVNGYGQVQEYLLIEDWLPIIKPDILLLMIYTHNDFIDNTYYDNWLYPRPIALWNEENESVEIKYPPNTNPIKQVNNDSQKSFLQKLHLYVFIDRRIHRIINRYFKKEEKKPYIDNISEISIFRVQLYEETKLRYRIMEKMLIKISDYANKMEIPLIYVIAPSIYQVQDADWNNILKVSGVKKEYFKRTLPNDRLMQFAEINKLNMIDLLPIMQSETKNNNILYNKNELHWNKEGNLVVAKTLLDYLKAKSFIE